MTGIISKTSESFPFPHKRGMKPESRVKSRKGSKPAAKATLKAPSTEKKKPPFEQRKLDTSCELPIAAPSSQLAPKEKNNSTPKPLQPETGSTTKPISILGNKPLPQSSIAAEIGRDFFKDRLAGPNIPGGKWLGKMQRWLQAPAKPSPSEIRNKQQTDFKNAVQMHEALLSAASRAGQGCVRVVGEKSTIEKLIATNKELENILKKGQLTKDDHAKMQNLQAELIKISLEIKICIKNENDAWGVADKVFTLAETLNSSTNWGFYLIQQIGSLAGLGIMPFLAGTGGYAATSIIGIPINLFFLHREYKKHQKISETEAVAEHVIDNIRKKKESAKLDPTAIGLSEETKLLRAMNKAILHQGDRTGRYITIASRAAAVISCCAYAFAGIAVIATIAGLTSASIISMAGGPIGIVLGTGLGILAFAIFTLYFSSKTMINYYEEQKNFSLFKETMNIADALDSEEKISIQHLYNQSSKYYKTLFEKIMEEYQLKDKLLNNTLTKEEFRQINRLIANKAMRKLVRYNADFAAEVLQRMLYAESLQPNANERCFTNWLYDLNENQSTFRDNRTITDLAAIDITNRYVPNSAKTRALTMLKKNVFNA
jgi:hypothetical protein